METKNGLVLEYFLAGVILVLELIFYLFVNRDHLQCR